MKSITIAVATATAAVLLLAGCTSASETSGDAKIELTAPASAPVSGERPEITTKKADAPFKIAARSFIDWLFSASTGRIVVVTRYS